MMPSKRMKSLIHGSLGMIASTMLTGQAMAMPNSGDSSCKFALSSYRYMVLISNDDSKYRALHYWIFSRDQRWQLSPLGWHATAVIKCPSCDDGQKFVAVLHITEASHYKRPQAIEKQRELSQHKSWFTWMEFHYNTGNLLGIEDAQIGNFKGWGLRFAAYLGGKHTHDVVELMVSDNCAALVVRADVPASKELEPLAPVTDMLKAIEIRSFEGTGTDRDQIMKDATKFEAENGLSRRRKPPDVKP